MSDYSKMNRHQKQKEQGAPFFGKAIKYSAKDSKVLKIWQYLFSHQRLQDLLKKETKD